MIELEILTGSDCSLCEAMKRSVARAIRGLEVRVRETNISVDAQLWTKYKNDIPVLFVNGSKDSQHRIDEKALRKRLKKEQQLGKGV